MKTMAIIAAGGSGKRLGADISKQYLSVGGLPVVVRTLRVFECSERVSGIVLVAPQSDLDFVREHIVEKYGITKVAAVVAGGTERQDSVQNALAALAGPCDMVIVHDGVRPFVTGEMIKQVVEAAGQTGAASIGVAAKDTIKETNDDNLVTATIPRGRLWLVQTPQAFRHELLVRAHARAKEDGFYGTDDASLVERIGVPVRMIAGSYENIKITTPDDLKIARALMSETMTSRTTFLSGIGYDSHRFAPGRKLILGGVEIPFDKGLAGHSDADALLHAVCDALLGMAGAGDIGRHFPDDDEAYRGISSLILLERVGAIIAGKGVSIGNIDVTVMTQQPKLAPYAGAMTANIARVLKIPEASVNIKAKTNEGMGFVGRAEGLAVLAVVSGMERSKND
ncbi:MAG: 2-C-methyl-D-erythritol 4-phosphate cytidylyltransferase [Smithella sp.]|jgi:2-C-methyl-D-erythritol 4-phosphate cytidylyltransferase/2-C-methyl-D-erythritol 2,4-cyclodiphosphate synthase|nr:2-C-methyl-D-erythritol 4-phosphate cytidylyltransferase [Smithella sp.]